MTNPAVHTERDGGLSLVIARALYQDFKEACADYLTFEQLPLFVQDSWLEKGEKALAAIRLTHDLTPKEKPKDHA